MTCSHCDHAATVDADAPGLNPSCYGCQLREIARGLPFFNSRKYKHRSPDYQAQLLGACGDKAKADEAHEYICSTLWPAIRARRAQVSPPQADPARTRRRQRELA